jgi:hypothetical protein
MKDEPAVTGRLLSVFITLLALSASFLFTPATLPKIDLCWFHRLTGLPCGGCGITRSVCCLSHGEFSRAWSYNPFGYFVYALAIAILAWPLIQKQLPGLAKAISNNKLRRIVVICVAVSFTLFSLGRIIWIIFVKGLPAFS